MALIESNSNHNQTRQQNQAQNQNPPNNDFVINLSIDEYYNRNVKKAFISDMNKKIGKDEFNNNPIKNTSKETEIEEYINKSPNIFHISRNEYDKIYLV